MMLGCVREVMVTRDWLVRTSHGCAQVRCGACSHFWVGIYPLDVEWPLECPACHQYVGWPDRAKRKGAAG